MEFEEAIDLVTTKRFIYYDSSSGLWLERDYNSGSYSGSYILAQGICYNSDLNAVVWFDKGKYHRIDGPAIIRGNGLKFFYLNDFYFKNKEEWFAALTSYEKYEAIWNI